MVVVGSNELRLLRVVRLCRTLAELLGASVALVPIAGSTLFQVCSTINPLTGKYSGSSLPILPKITTLGEIEIELSRYIALAQVRNQARCDLYTQGKGKE